MRNNYEGIVMQCASIEVGKERLESFDRERGTKLNGQSNDRARRKERSWRLISRTSYRIIRRLTASDVINGYNLRGCVLTYSFCNQREIDGGGTDTMW